MDWPRLDHCFGLGLGMQAGWTCTAVLTMNEVYAMLPADELKRVEKLEWLDEVEEWKLINDHYCLGCVVLLATIRIQSCREDSPPIVCNCVGKTRHQLYATIPCNLRECGSGTLPARVHFTQAQRSLRSFSTIPHCFDPLLEVFAVAKVVSYSSLRSWMP
jgi:hypothetical protein